MAVSNAYSVPHRQYFYCDSNDNKPTANLYVGDRIYETDTGNHFIWDGGNWQEYFQPAYYEEQTP